VVDARGAQRRRRSRRGRRSLHANALPGDATGSNIPAAAGKVVGAPIASRVAKSTATMRVLEPRVSDVAGRPVTGAAVVGADDGPRRRRARSPAASEEEATLLCTRVRVGVRDECPCVDSCMRPAARRHADSDGYVAQGRSLSGRDGRCYAGGLAAFVPPGLHARPPQAEGVDVRARSFGAALGCRPRRVRCWGAQRVAAASSK
jgi:hypothetical protein